MAHRRLDEYLRQVSRGVREGSIDVEALIKRLAEELIASLPQAQHAPAGGGDVREVVERLEELVARLERLEERISRLESAVEKLKVGGGSVEVRLSEKDVERIASLIAAAVAKAAQQLRQQSRQEPRWLQEVMDRVKSRGYVLLSELSDKVREQVNVALLAEKGLIVERLGGDVVIASVEGIRRFEEMLSKVRTSDEFEAELKLADYARLFRLLREEGLVYYKHDRGWVLRAFKSTPSPYQ
jgi:DNA-binding protein YbaB